MTDAVVGAVPRCPVALRLPGLRYSIQLNLVYRPRPLPQGEGWGEGGATLTGPVIRHPA